MDEKNDISTNLILEELRKINEKLDGLISKDTEKEEQLRKQLIESVNGLLDS